jgi:predicted TIM-barrel fold metal-dependent hydrolase
MITEVSYRICDADQHYYEATDSLTRHLGERYKNIVRWVRVGERETLLIKDRVLTLVPNPTYDPVGAPGSLETYFRGDNTDGKELRDIIKMIPIPEASRKRDVRIETLDNQGVDTAWVLPSLGLGIEEMLNGDSVALHAILESYNRWLDDDWGYSRDTRILTAPLMSLCDPSSGVRELKRVLELGAKIVVMRPASVQDGANWRSIADKRHDEFWHTAAEAGVTVAFHGADSGYGRHLVALGENDSYGGMKQSTLGEVLGIHVERPVYELVSSMICHGLFDRVSNLKIATVELGAGWVPELVRRLEKSFGKTPQMYRRDPIETLREHVHVSPFYEDDIPGVVKLLGEDNVLLGSDWPHPEGLESPRDWIKEFKIEDERQAEKILRGNLKKLSGLTT